MSESTYDGGEGEEDSISYLLRQPFRFYCPAMAEETLSLSPQPTGTAKGDDPPKGEELSSSPARARQTQGRGNGELGSGKAN